MRILVGLAVSVWMVVHSSMWSHGPGAWSMAALALVSYLSVAVAMGGVWRTGLAARSPLPGMKDRVAHHATIAVLGGAAFSASEVVQRFGFGIGAFQGCLLTLFGALLAWACSRLVLGWTGYRMGTWRADLALAAGSILGGGMTLIWIYGLSALSFLAENAMMLTGMIGVVFFGILGLTRLDRSALLSPRKTEPGQSPQV